MIPGGLVDCLANRRGEDQEQRGGYERFHSAPIAFRMIASAAA